LLVLGSSGATCGRSSGDGSGPAGSAPGARASARARLELAGVDTTALTPREHRAWSEHVSELIAPCPETAVPLVQCIEEKRACAVCVPAAQFVAKQVQAGRPKKEVVELYETRFLPGKVKTLVIEGSAVKGPEDAPVTIVEFADFECPSCGVAYPLIEKVFERMPGKVRIAFKHYPLRSHPNAQLAAQAAVAAQLQGRFWQMHKILFERQERLTEPDLVAYAKEAGLDVARFRKDLHSEEAKQRVATELKQGEGLGVNATPTLFINGRECDLTKFVDPERELEEWIRLELTVVRPPGGDKP
jgi:protein-disulfide isomerase